MLTKYLQAFISAENKKQANKILDVLLKKKLIAGGLILHGPTRFWWKGKIINTNYYNISAFTKDSHKKAIVEGVRETSSEEVPMVWFVPFKGNEEFISWIDENVV
ncbi:hypothetical protein A3C98_05005 [Candidatus Roizmanbacteria bacterium RIFCSPHIGHO2_02_FULL_37_15]|uniref:Uncharacterized protein n=1 Tax=Candidatus Roizmanbacteria bacterium RIFCSPLOWO2_01_FULL_37_16 TaxID=1802058 RepID=A0A1F7IK52_9BACT|nr:MAG: hypothetical protein A2859_02170 [Candidatus Roizmanbacteria bacterium RIFCSPHIGHO2_01_FULL_37_16b]OGK22429.1 MAG: hypothetical protein A3C98_05005 [Candidatus Roizmanbacteria bacterium RIFCSPHIGHO2_02_FULL_37_15]OGK32107.1 MAG: hypothetical protein A3F57_03475 [Candidatus Roizmanbacteria bacterium RIFCSPHIGHO2_12_FULL_36_11]OGK43742.1 MAG: hypothetical protein A3B40_03475 [Candidatus Roizmanbacteria bacterium RIFCSPLOWO2_01_FULL_37_16]